MFHDTKNISTTLIVSTFVSAFQALEEFLKEHPDPDILVMGTAFWSICCKPNHEMALEEYSAGLHRLIPVIL